MREILNLLTEGIGDGLLCATGRLGRMVSAVPCNVRELEDKYEITVNVSEYKKEEVSVSVKDGNVVISGEHKEEENAGDATYLLKERLTSNFSRKFSFSDIVEDKIAAALENGILTVTLPKVPKEEAPEEKKIEIQ